jgi:hypothetical protein
MVIVARHAALRAHCARVRSCVHECVACTACTHAQASIDARTSAQITRDAYCRDERRRIS